MKKNKADYKKAVTLVGFALLCLFLLPCVLYAQTDTAKKLKEVKISSLKTVKLTTITPAQQIAATDFDRYSAFNVADAIKNFAGVNIKDYGGIGGLKTVSVRGLGANYTSVLYDGVQLNDAENGQVDLGKLNLNNIQVINLYNGQPPEICMPARSFASASVLAIKTIRPNLTIAKPYQFLIGIKDGSFGLISPYLQWQQRINNKWSLIINSYWEKADGQYKFRVHGDGADTVSKRKNANINAQETDGSLYWAKNDSNKFNLHINYYNSDRGLPSAIIFYNSTPSRQRIWNENVFVQSGYERLWTNSLHLLVNAKASAEYTRYADPNYPNNSGGLNEHYTERELYGSAALSYHLLSDLEISYATDVAITKFDADLYNFAYPTRLSLLNVLASNLNLGRWHFQGSLLNTHINENVETGITVPSKNIVSPTFITTYQPFNNPGLQFRAFYKNIFRAPTLDEQYAFTVNGARGVKPEYAKQYDLGLTYGKQINSFLDYISITFDVYYNTVTNKIIALPNQNIAISSIINLGKTYIKGVDLGLKTQTRNYNGWHGSLVVDYTYQHAIDSASDVQIPYTPQNLLALNVGVDYKKAGLYYNQVLSSSRYYLSNPGSLVNGYSVSDISLIYKLLLNKLPAIISFHADNVFNQDYVVVRSFPMPGRSFLLSFQITI